MVEENGVLGFTSLVVAFSDVPIVDMCMPKQDKYNVCMYAAHAHSASSLKYSDYQKVILFSSRLPE